MTDPTTQADRAEPVAPVAPLTTWPATTTDDDTALRQQLQALLRGWEDGFDAGAAYYSRDRRIRIWDGSPVDGPGYDAYAAAARPWLETVAELHNTPTDVQVLRDPAGGLAVTVTFLDSQGTMKDGMTFASHMRETLVWAKDGDQWRVVHEHTSTLPQQPEGDQ